MAVTTTNLGVITAYGDAVAAGYTGTKAEWQTLMASYATVGQQAVDAKDDAVAAKNIAVQKATDASTAAGTATQKANEASASAQSIAQSASQIAQNTSDISELKEDLTTLAPKEDMLKSFPTDTASGSVASFADGANVPVKSLIVNIDPVQEGSGDPSPTNVRPISGWSEVNVQRAGKNLLPKYEDGATKTQNGITATANADGSITYVGTSTGSFWGIGSSPSIRLKAGSYTLSANNNANINVNIVNADTNNYIDGISGNNSKTITFGADTNIYYYTSVPSGKTVNTTATYQLELGSAVTAYEPYQPVQSVNIALGQTVYGGTFDVVSGELVIDFAKITIDGSSTICQTGSAVSSPVLIQVIPPAQNIAFIDEKTIPRCLCGSYLPPTTAYGIYRSADLGIAINQTESRTERRIWMRLPEVTTEAQAKTYLTDNPIDVVYPIYNPLTITLTPHEVTALLGNNNIWADSGDSAVEYRADPTLYISRLTEPDADMVADANIVSGQYFMVGNTLYKATANIASGATIVPSVNCTRKSLSEALNELNA